jgi:hypothetical protein
MRKQFLFLAVVASGIMVFTTAAVQAVDITVGTEVFGDTFEGNPDPSTLDASKWSSFVSDANAAVIMNENYPGTHVEIYSAQGGTGGAARTAHISTVSPLNFSASAEDWWAQVGFKFPVQGGIWAAPNANESSARQYVILQGQHAIDGTQANAQGFDLRAVRIGPSLWGLAWLGFDENTLRLAEVLDDNAGAGYAFDDVQNYVVSVHRKPDGNVDIYLDKSAGDGSASDLIATKPLIGGLNPVGMTSGDWSTTSAGYLLLDWVNVGVGPEVSDDGDYNQDGLVDAADYVAWRKSGAPEADYETWVQTFGQPSAGESSAPLGGSVPEPASFLLFGAGMLLSVAIAQARTGRDSNQHALS